jgi:hypothetical protein
MPAVATHTRGTIAYRDADGAQTGHESFDLVQGCGGQRLLRALCIMNDIGLVREVSIGMGADWRPTDGQCRLWQAGAAPSLLRFAVETRAVQVWGDDEAQTLPTPAPLPYLGLHPLAGDALVIHQRGTDAPGQYRPIDAVTNSISPNGDAPGANLACAMQIGVAYMGRGPCQVAAGQFDAWHYRLMWRDDWPPADLWVRAGDGLFLLMRWPLVPAWFELVAWETL